ncbi:lipopolysaccharide heptosyltransferase II [Helicobacter sp. 11S02629-2]|uniref:lipopolysaccharide heptosyltransferase II n=1 Tax=Helicobacter sp. 11S02629-2 TaxID=1476195 RepID=UPI000BA5FA51|nr:lipopolysaccharide heptosyltransferase II [Helicobacter sp. 11S02629-2]PAF45939.1 lipopolysaccharide heptosyltransferase II [Helicobacter sp. 11S02629-2]
MQDSVNADSKPVDSKMINPKIEENLKETLLIRLPNWLGDCVMLTPTLELLKKHFEVVLVGNKLVLELFSCDSFIKELVIDSTKEDSKKHRFKLLARIKATISLAKSLKKKHNFKYAITFQNAFFSALLLRFSSAKVRIGYSGLRSFLLTHPIKKALGKAPVCKHQVLSYASLLTPLASLLDLESKNLKSPLYDTALMSKNQALIYENLGALRLKVRSKKQDSLDTKILGLSFGASFGISKRWPLEYYAELASYFLSKGYEVRLFGALSEKDLGDRLEALITKNASNLKSLNNLVGKTTIKTLIDSINECSVHVGNDSGNSHIAVALSVPSISFYGPTPSRWGYPWHVTSKGADAGVDEDDHTFLGRFIAIRKKELPCLGCKQRICPLKHHNCMKLITPDEVIDLSNYLVSHNF